MLRCCRTPLAEFRTVRIGGRVGPQATADGSAVASVAAIGDCEFRISSQFRDCAGANSKSDRGAMMMILVIIALSLGNHYRVFGA